MRRQRHDCSAGGVPDGRRAGNRRARGHGIGIARRGHERRRQGHHSSLCGIVSRYDRLGGSRLVSRTLLFDSSVSAVAAFSALAALDRSLLVTPDSKANTALHYAAYSGNAPLVRYLIDERVRFLFRAFVFCLSHVASSRFCRCRKARIFTAARHITARPWAASWSAPRCATWRL